MMLTRDGNEEIETYPPPPSLRVLCQIFGENARTASEPVWLQRIQHQQDLLLRWLRGQPFRNYCLQRALLKYGIRSWIPWFLSLAVDITGLGFLSLATRSRHVGKEQTFHLSTSEKNELKRRKLLWALHFMRDPFFSKYTRQRLESTGKQLEPIPIIGFIIGFLTGTSPEV
ncbi:hypothetical protein CUMW_275000 [Citrus unshiu]|uniref:Peroxisomal membrane protein PEX16 n=1 Tax=Citrus unshiu TaxID=55188 RepID=A0A2H5MZH3_CITUN|nr:hypothetical protein CUMW_275000 [Citrus unshiu]